MIESGSIDVNEPEIDGRLPSMGLCYMNNYSKTRRSGVLISTNTMLGVLYYQYNFMYPPTPPQVPSLSMKAPTLHG